MKSHRVYLLVTFLIFTLQVAFLSLASESQSGSKIDQMRIQALEQSVGSLKSKLSQARRDLAIAENKLISEQSRFYEKKLKRKTASVQDSNRDPDKAAQAIYNQIDISCDKDISSKCLEGIDQIVTNYPNSKWAAKSLLLLSHLYFVKDKKDEAKKLIYIVRQEFKSYEDFNSDIQKLSKRKL